MTIRPAQKQDAVWLADRLQALYHHALSTSNDTYLRLCTPQSPHSLAEWFVTEINEAHSTIFVAADEERLLGFIRGFRERPFAQPSTLAEIGYVSMVWVDPPARRKGIARLLTERLEAHFRDEGLQYVDLHYLIGNNEATHTWLRLGYHPYRVAARKELGINRMQT